MSELPNIYREVFEFRRPSPWRYAFRLAAECVTITAVLCFVLWMVTR